MYVLDLVNLSSGTRVVLQRGQEGDGSTCVLCAQALGILGNSLTQGCAAGAPGSLHGSQGQRGWDGLMASTLMPSFRAVPGHLGGH